MNDNPNEVAEWWGINETPDYLLEPLYPLRCPYCNKRVWRWWDCAIAPWDGQRYHKSCDRREKEQMRLLEESE